MASTSTTRGAWALTRVALRFSPMAPVVGAMDDLGKLSKVPELAELAERTAAEFIACADRHRLAVVGNEGGNAMELLVKVAQDHDAVLRVAAVAGNPEAVAARIRDLSTGYDDWLINDAQQRFYTDLTSVFAPLACGWAQTHLGDGRTHAAQLTEVLADLQRQYAVLLEHGRQHGETHEAVLRIEHAVTRPGAAGLSAGRMVVGRIPDPPLQLVARDELDDLEEALRESGRAVVCAGGRGVGKTALAATYVAGQLRRPASEGPRLVAWVTGETIAGLVTGLAGIAERLHLTRPDGTDEDHAAAARDYLTGTDHPALLVIDNAEHPTGLHDWLPAGASSCRVLLTSTNKGFTEYAAPVPLGGFDRPQSVDYLTRRTGRDDPAGADAVAEELGDLPLALAQAAAYLARKTRLTYRGYLERLATTPLADALPAEQAGGAYPRSVAAAITLSIQAVLEDNPDVGPVLAALAVLDPAGTSLDVLDHVYPHLTNLETAIAAAFLSETPDTPAPPAASAARDVDDLTALLTDASLTTTSSDSVTIHRLIARTIREHLTPHLDAILTAAADGLTDHVDQRPRPTPPEHSFRTAGHATALFHHAHTAGEACALHVADMGFDVATVLRDDGYPRSALPIDEATISLRTEHLRPDHPYTLHSRNNLALTYSDLGRHHDALTLQEDTLARFEKALGPDHRDTLRSRDNLAAYYSNLGRYHDALALDEGTLARLEKALGPDHPYTLHSRDNLASTYSNLGRHHDALTLLEGTLARFEKAFGPDHPYTLHSRHGLALTYGDLGRYDDALSLHKDTLARFEKALGPDHPYTLHIRYNLASTYSELGRHHDALTLLEDTLARREHTLGPDHPYTLHSRHGLASTYSELGRHHDALTLHKDTLTRYEQTLGPDHPDTLKSCRLMAWILRELGRDDEADAFERRADGHPGGPPGDSPN